MPQSGGEGDVRLVSVIRRGRGFRREGAGAMRDENKTRALAVQKDNAATLSRRPAGARLFERGHAGRKQGRTRHGQPKGRTRRYE